MLIEGQVRQQLPASAIQPRTRSAHAVRSSRAGAARPTAARAVFHRPSAKGRRVVGATAAAKP